MCDTPVRYFSVKHILHRVRRDQLVLLISPRNLSLIATVHSGHPVRNLSTFSAIAE